MVGESMKEKMKRFIAEHNLLEYGDRIIVGVSGGADSVCLLHLLYLLKEEYQLTLRVVHINHGIREVTAQEDEAYVRDLCKKLCLDFHAYFYEVEKIAVERGISTEEAGRNVRYEAFVQECMKYNGNKVAIAHNQNDTAETVLFHLVRGSGLQGLTGIPRKRKLTNNITIIRPLLCFTREEIERYLREQEIGYQTDETNLETHYSRNKLRNVVFPYLKEELNEGVIPHIANTANQLRELQQFVENGVFAAYDRYVTKTEQPQTMVLGEEITSEHIVIQKGVIRSLIGKLLPSGLKDVDALHIETICDLFRRQVGRRICLPNQLIAVRQYHGILFRMDRGETIASSQKKMNPRNIDIHTPREYYFPEIGKTLEVHVIKYEKNRTIPKNAYTKWFDYDKINNTVCLRTRQQGDYIQVNQEGGTKKIKDYFIDQKIPREKRDYYPIIADGSHVMWIIGDRISEGYKVSDQTKTILVISLIGGNVT